MIFNTREKKLLNYSHERESFSMPFQTTKTVAPADHRFHAMRGV